MMEARMSARMSFKGIVQELKEIREGFEKLSKRGGVNHWWGRTRSHIVPDQGTLSKELEQGRWANLPPELLLDIIRRVEASETSWPARTSVVFCAAVCKSWREVTKEIVKTPEQCGRLTFPISLKQPGPRDFPIQCFIKRDMASSTFRLFCGLTPAEDENDKLLLIAKKIRRATSTEFVISLVADDFSRASYAYVGKLRSNFLGTKFTIYDSQPPCDATVKVNHPSSRRLPGCNYNIATISYEFKPLRPRGPRKLHCVMHSIPHASIEEGGHAPTPKSFPHSFDEPCLPSPGLQGKDDHTVNFSSTSLSEPQLAVSGDPLFLKNKEPRWHEQLRCWCLNFRGRVTVASVKNFQLVAVEPHQTIPAAEQDKVILQFGKIGKDIFTMDYGYPLSAFQAFAICLSSFDTKPACE